MMRGILFFNYIRLLSACLLGLRVILVLTVQVFTSNFLLHTVQPFLILVWIKLLAGFGSLEICLIKLKGQCHEKSCSAEALV